MNTNHGDTVGAKTYLINMDALSKRCDEDARFCVICLRTRTDVPVVDHCCYSCGGGEEDLQ
jgi:hypothetical protein